MENAPTSIVIIRPPPPFPAPPRSVDLSALEFILALIAIITIPALIYTFLFAIKCPPFQRRQRTHRESYSGGSAVSDNTSETTTETKENPTTVSGVKYKKEVHVKDIGSECPVCLSVFADGEEVRQLTACKHSFHSSCIDIWLNSHSNCPICRASVAVKRPNNNNSRSGSAARDREDLQQGLPDAGALV